MLRGQREQEVIALTKRLISAQSVSGQERAAAEELMRYMTEKHFDEVIADGYGNVIGRITGKRPGPRLLFDGHIDTVPVGNEQDWRHKPFVPEIDEGRLYGRGASDMKGAVAAFTAAAAFYAEDLDRDFPGEICIAGVVHEECFEGIAARQVSDYVKPDFVVIGEATQLNINIGQRGRAELMVETIGRPAHSANPEKGLNAVYKMYDVIRAIQALPPPEHSMLGKGIMELTDIKSSPYPGASVVPEYCRATYDRRLLVGETPESVLKPIEDVINQLAAEDPTLNARVSIVEGEALCYTGTHIKGQRFFPGWLCDSGEPFVQSILKTLRDRGYTPEVGRYNFCTNGSHYAGEAGIPTIGLGPSPENLAHTIDEYIELSQLFGAANCYYGVMKALLKDKTNEKERFS